MLPETEQIGIQQVVFSEYEVSGQKSDSEGQLITYEPERFQSAPGLGLLNIKIVPGKIKRDSLGTMAAE